MKLEAVYREILFNVYEKKNTSFTQKSLSEKCKISIGNVNYSLEPLEEMGAIEKKARRFIVINPKKILMYWASKHKLKPVYQTFVNMSVIDIEKSLPQGILFGAYSAYKLIFKNIPAEYSEVYIYADEKGIKKIEDRFPEKKGNANLIVLEADEHLKTFKKMPLSQIYVDLWNINKWYAQDFLKALEEKIEKLV